MANTPIQNRDVLRLDIQREITQKIRLEGAINRYKIELKKAIERVVDQAEIIRSMELKPSNTSIREAIIQAKDRLKRLSESRDMIANRLNILMNRNIEMIKDGQAHMIALSEIEIEQGGFVALLFGVRDQTEFKPENESLLFKPGGSAETMIGLGLSSWKDSSQLSITKIVEVKQ